jgi:hypothetical protein
MSDGLLTAARLGNHYLQSPVDDLWSFYYVAQWAAVFNNTNFPDSTLPTDDLKDLRDLISGSQYERCSGTRTITDPGLDPTEYGQFLVECSSILREWDSKLRQLTASWKAAKVNGLTDGDLYNARYPHFRNFTNRGVLELLQLVQQHFGALSGPS